MVSLTMSKWYKCGKMFWAKCQASCVGITGKIDEIDWSLRKLLFYMRIDCCMYIHISDDLQYDQE